MAQTMEQVDPVAILGTARPWNVGHQLKRDCIESMCKAAELHEARFKEQDFDCEDASFSDDIARLWMIAPLFKLADEVSTAYMSWDQYDRELIEHCYDVMDEVTRLEQKVEVAEKVAVESTARAEAADKMAAAAVARARDAEKMATERAEAAEKMAAEAIARAQAAEKAARVSRKPPKKRSSPRLSPTLSPKLARTALTHRG